LQQAACIFINFINDVNFVVNADQTGLRLVPSGRFTWDYVGETLVRVVSHDDKRQLIATVGSRKAGDLLPLQVIYQGKTTAMANIRDPSFQWLHLAWSSLAEDMYIIHGAWRGAGFLALLDPDLCDEVRRATLEPGSRVASLEHPTEEEGEEVEMALWPNPQFLTSSHA
jgi:hypothetical protein